MSWEYSFAWHKALYYDSYNSTHSLAEAQRAGAPTLQTFQLKMAAYGYDTYLIAGVPNLAERRRTTRRGGFFYELGRTYAAVFPQPLARRHWGRLTMQQAEASVTLVPVYGQFYRPFYEICLHRHAPFRQPWCWNDLLVVRRANTALKQRLLHVLHRSVGGGHNLSLPFGADCTDCL